MRRRAATPAKITSPKPQGVLARPRLFKLLDGARSRPLIWITAPPGAGKTTLVSHYLRQRKLKHLWYQVDEGDADFATLLHYLALAARHADPRVRKPLPQLAPEHRPNLNAFFRVFFEALFGRWKTPPVLAFDNYQEIPAGGFSHEAIREAIGQMPRGSNLFVLSRDDPPAAFARAQMDGQVACINWDALKLTSEEAGRVMDMKGNKDALPPVIRERLFILCEGWIAGLLLLLETVKTHEIVDQAPQTFAPQVLFDYFSSQIFDRMDRATKEVLMQSAFLPKMAVTAVEELTGSPDARRAIENLHRRNYFIVRLGDDPPVYQYHPLFRDFLLNRAAALVAPEDLKDIMQRAGTLLEEAGQIEDAIGLYRDIPDEARIVGIIVRYAPALMAQGRTETIVEWIHALPENTVQHAPWLLYWLGVCTLAADPAKSRQFLERTLQLFDAEPNSAGVYLSWSAIINSIIYSWNDFHPLRRWVEVFDELRARHGDFPSLEIEIQVVGGVFAAMLFGRLDDPRLGYWAERLEKLLSNSSDPALIVSLGSQLLNYHLWFGYFNKARPLAEMLEAHVGKPSTPAAALLHWGMIGAAYYWSMCDFDACARADAPAREIVEKQGLRVPALLILTQEVHAQLARGEFDVAAVALKKIRDYLADSAAFPVGHYHFLVAMTALFRGDLAAARASVDTALLAVETCGAAFPLVAGHFAAAQVAFAEGDYEHASAHVARGRSFMSSVTVDYFCALFDARLAFTRGEDAAGLQFLRAALALGNRYGIVHYPWWSPQSMADFYAKALAAGIEVPYVVSVIRKRRLMSPTPEVVDWPWPVKVYTLGRFGVLIDGEPLQFAGKAQRKPIELLMALIAFGGREVNEAQLTEALWPDAEGDAAHEACAIALHRLRKLLRIERAVGLQLNHFSLDPRYVWVDVWAFERGLAAAQSDPGNPRSVERIASLYQGPFLARHMEFAWALPLRERLRSKFLRYVVQCGRALIESREFEAAVVAFEQGLNADPLAEELYRGLMRCYGRMDRRSEAIRTYQRCQKMLAAALGVAPAAETVALYQELRR